MSTVRNWSRRTALTLMAGLGLLAQAALPAPAAAGEIRSACAPSPAWRLEALNYYGEWQRAGGVDLTVNACPWTTSDRWTVDVAQASTTGGFARSGWRVRAWVVNGDATPIYRNVTVQVRVDHCPGTRCSNDVASFEGKLRLVADEYTRQVITDTSITEWPTGQRGWRLATT
ncbi:hypothetical protein [Kitasatospora sp. NPDC093679]|uniref:hypothetical protein n=1 Tax=Kitasatospora sp. NPDC093679 TaxID=3154983 RepID=UPI003436695A